VAGRAPRDHDPGGHRRGGARRLRRRRPALRGWRRDLYPRPRPADDAPARGPTAWSGATASPGRSAAAALQEYVGIADGEADAVEVRLPFGWWLGRPGWYPQPYYDSWFEAEYDGERPRVDVYAAAEPWAARCAWCHNTYPFALRLARPGVGHGPERDLAPVAPAVVDNVLPIAARW
jgi:hypothetical protein